MRRLIYIQILFIAILTASCSRARMLEKNATKAHIEFKETAHNFGTIIFGQPAICSFDFVNTGSDTLVISEIQSTCGCTVPKWSREPVPPKAKGTITVSYDSQRSGEFEKGITVFSNAENSAILLVIRGSVTTNPHKFILGPAIHPDDAEHTEEQQTIE